MPWARSPTERRIDPSLFYNNFISLAYVRPGIHTLVLHSFFFTLKKKAGGHTYSSALKKRLLVRKTSIQWRKKGHTSGGGKLKAGPNLVRGYVLPLMRDCARFPTKS